MTNLPSLQELVLIIGLPSWLALFVEFYLFSRAKREGISNAKKYLHDNHAERVPKARNWAQTRLMDVIYNSKKLKEWIGTSPTSETAMQLTFIDRMDLESEIDTISGALKAVTLPSTTYRDVMTGYDRKLQEWDSFARWSLRFALLAPVWIVLLALLPDSQEIGGVLLALYVNALLVLMLIPRWRHYSETSTQLERSETVLRATEDDPLKPQLEEGVGLKILGVQDPQAE